jgi:hypothetical protein
MGGTCGTGGRYDRCMQAFVGRPGERDSLEDLRVDGMSICKWLLMRQVKRECNVLPYFLAHKTHRDFIIRNFRGKK